MRDMLGLCPLSLVGLFLSRKRWHRSFNRGSALYVQAIPFNQVLPQNMSILL